MWAFVIDKTTLTKPEKAKNSKNFETTNSKFLSKKTA